MTFIKNTMTQINQIRTVVIDNRRVSELLDQQKKLADEMDLIMKEEEKNERKKQKIALKQGAIKDRLHPLIVDDLLAVTKLNDYEVITKVGKEDGKVMIHILDQLEMYKQILIDKRDAAKAIENNAVKVGEHTEDGGNPETAEENKTE